MDMVSTATLCALDPALSSDWPRSASSPVCLDRMAIWARCDFAQFVSHALILLSQCSYRTPGSARSS
eukprot:9303057-Alexandrium_andersonii.AAC.1